jgi:glycosyltransferase involved in cell wall biosynthesis
MYGTLDPAPYRELIHRLGIADRVTVSGSVPHAEVPATLRRFDVYAMPSLSESFGVAALEASSCGVPVVASSVGGTPEVIRHGETGFLVPPCDPTALADALAELLREPERRHAMGRAGRAFVKGHYEWATCVDRMEALYEQVARLRA